VRDIEAVVSVDEVLGTRYVIMDVRSCHLHKLESKEMHSLRKVKNKVAPC